jgi:hypothetical protein
LLRTASTTTPFPRNGNTYVIAVVLVVIVVIVIVFFVTVGLC